MNLELGGKHILITGGSRGIGLACARAFGAEGARVSIVSKRRESVDAALADLKQRGTTCAGFDADLTDPAAATRMVDAAEQALGPVDVLVNSAGAARRTPFAELTATDWHAAMDNKFFTYVHVITPVLARMGQRRSGTVVNVIGQGGKVATTTHLAGGAANAALMLVTAGLAAAWAPNGVRVNAVNPGLTLTDRLAEGLRADARQQGITEDEARARAEKRLPMGRIATPEEIADAVLWLASARASYVNGAILAMDGAVTPIVV
jgi:NAD(P)-dependent dehydrogenase (short-subunit alcohol dehydrogenase family)